MERVVNQPSHSHDIRLLLLGKTGSGVSTSGNTILGSNKFPCRRSMTSITQRCQKHTAEVSNRKVTVLDTPTFFNTENSDLSVELMRGLDMCSSGFHALLLVFSLNTFTKQDADVVSLYKQMLGENAMKYTLVLFTHGDEFQNKSLKQLLKENAELSKFTEECGGRFHLMNNKDPNNREQVTKLLMKIERMVFDNENSCYTLQMFKTQSFKVFLLRFMKPKYLYAVSIFVAFAMGCVNMRNEGSFAVKSFLYGCAGGVLSAVTGSASGAVYTVVCKNHQWRSYRFSEEHLKSLPAIMCGCAAGMITVYFVGPMGLLATSLRGIQGGVMAYATMMNHCRTI